MSIRTDQDVLAYLYKNSSFAQSWSELENGMKVKLVCYDDNGFIKYRKDWIDCEVKIIPNQERPELHDEDGCTWHDCLSHPYEIEITNQIIQER